MNHHLHRIKIIALFTLLIVSLSLIIIHIYQYLSQPQVVIVPHHDLVRQERLQVLQAVAHKRPKTSTIILLSPDHFNPDQHQITSSSQDLTTSQGIINSDQVIDQILSTIIRQDDNAIKNDHGIYALLRDIKSLFPHTKLVPILLGQKLEAQDLKPLADILNKSCLSDCLIIASVDFSHYLPASLAMVHDAFSLKILSSANLAKIFDLEVDSPQALYLALNHAISQKTFHFILKKHTNSGQLLNNYDIETTTHLMGWYQRSNPLFRLSKQTSKDNQTFLFARDIEITPNQKTVGERFTYGVDQVDTKLQQSQTLAPNLQIIPTTGSNSTISTVGQNLTIYLSTDLAVAGVVDGNSWELFFLPLSGVGQDSLLSRGSVKRVALDLLFSNIPNNFSKDLTTGRITNPTRSVMLRI